MDLDIHGRLPHGGVVPVWVKYTLVGCSFKLVGQLSPHNPQVLLSQPSISSTHSLSDPQNLSKTNGVTSS